MAARNMQNPKTTQTVGEQAAPQISSMLAAQCCAVLETHFPQIMTEHLVLCALKVQERKNRRGQNASFPIFERALCQNLQAWSDRLAKGQKPVPADDSEDPPTTYRIAIPVGTTRFVETIFAASFGKEVQEDSPQDFRGQLAAMTLADLERGLWTRPFLQRVYALSKDHYHKNQENADSALVQNPHEFTAVHITLATLIQALGTKSKGIKAIDSLLRKEIPEILEDGKNPENPENPENSKKKRTGVLGGYPDRLEIQVPEAGAPQGEITFEIPCRKLVRMYRENELPPVTPRERELDLMVHLLGKKSAANPVISSASGTGKTAAIRGLAQRIAKNPESLPEWLRTIEILEIPDMVYAEKKMIDPILSAVEEAGAVLVMDGIHNLVEGNVFVNQARAGQAGELLRAGLENGSLKILGATLPDEWKQTVAKNPSLAGLFTLIQLREPEPEILDEILELKRDSLQKHHSVQYSRKTIETLKTLGGTFLGSIPEPMRSVHLMDLAGSAARIAGEKFLSEKHIEAVLARLTGIPSSHIGAMERRELLEVETKMKSEIFGQDEAIESLVSCLQNARIGNRRKGKPVGCWLFTGQTGTGKTETVYALGRATERKVERIDMSEFSEPHTLSNLIGAPPGYVGYGDRNRLVDSVKDNPGCIFLFDEIEKAHPVIRNTLLGLMDSGSLSSRSDGMRENSSDSDGDGRQADFSRCMIVMTSNVGSRELSQRSMGFTGGMEVAEGNAKKALEKQFKPEFRNRFDAIVQYKPLQEDTLLLVAKKFIGRAKTRYLEQGVDLRISPKGTAWIARNGYEHAMGARPMERLVERVTALANPWVLDRDPGEKTRTVLTMQVPTEDSPDILPEWQERKIVKSAKSAK